MTFARNIDLMHNFTERRTSRVVYVVPHHVPFTAGLVPLPLSRTKIPCTSIIVQSDLANGGIVVPGGPDVSLLTGVQLVAGSATSFYADQGPTDAIIRAAMGIGVERYAAQLHAPDSTLKVISLSDIWIVATLAAQICHVTYFQWTF